MKKNDSTRFSILKKLLYSDSGLSVNDLADFFSISTMTVYRHVNNLRVDIKNVFTKNEVQVTQQGIYLSIVCYSYNLVYIIDSMNYYYIKKSTKFSVLKSLFNKRYPSIEYLAQELHISPAQVYQNVAFFNKLIMPFDLKIKFGHSSSQSNIHGSQVNLRIIMFLTYLNIYRGTNLPFQTAPSLFRDVNYPIKHHLITSSQLLRLTQYQIITYTQLISRKQKINLPDDFFTYLTVFDSISPTVFPAEITQLFDKNIFSDNDIKKEEAFMGFVLRFFVPNIDSTEDTLAIAKKLFTTKLPLTDFSVNLLNDFKDCFNIHLTDKEYFSHLYFLVIYSIYYQFIGLDLLSIDTYKTQTSFAPTEMQQLEKFVTQRINVYSFKNNSVKYFKPHIVKILCGILKKNRVKKLTIFVHDSKSIYLNDFIKKNLALTFSTKSMAFTNDIYSADLIITDGFSEVRKYKQVFYLEDPYDSDNWSELLIFISKLLFNQTYLT